MAAATRHQLLSLCRTVLSPVVRADQGALYIVALTDDEIALHLAGTCSGCPGAKLTIHAVIEPAVRRVAPGIRLTVTVGAKRPKGAVLVEDYKLNA
ncbi:MAG: NifU family protein [Polyangiaceae bacterium]|jgi:Fe-S cluster biogenesis protein NfuA|nr:NifU family protein [Polyangiaceae bacterium]